MDKNKVIDYVMNSPANTNRAVLEGMLEGDNTNGNLILLPYTYEPYGSFYLDNSYEELYEMQKSGKALAVNFIEEVEHGDGVNKAVILFPVSEVKYSSYTKQWSVSVTYNGSTLTSDSNDHPIPYFTLSE
jgi:hypothetical protein